MATARGSRGERDDDLALFHEMQRREREKKHSLSMPPLSENQHSDTNHAKLANPTVCRMATSTAATGLYRGRTSGEELLASDTGKNDYDWLMTPPGTPLVTNVLENEPIENGGYISAQKGLPNLVKSLTMIKTNRISRESTAMASRSSDPTSRSTRGGGGGNLYNNSPAGGPLRRSSLAPAAATSSSVQTSKPSSMSRPLTPSRSRPTNPSPSTNGNTATLAKSNTISSSSSAKPGPTSSRSTTPLRRPSTPVMSQGQAAPVRSSSANRASSLPSRNTPASRGSSPNVRANTPRAWQPSAMPGFSLEPPPNLRTTTSVSTRSVSNSRGASISSGCKPGVQSSMGSAKPGASSSPSLGSLRPRMSSSPSLGPSRPVTPTRTRPGTPSKTGAATRQSGGSSSFSTSSSSSGRTSIGHPWPNPPSPSSTTSSRTSESLLLDRSRRQSSSPSLTRGRSSAPERPLSRNGRSDGNSSDMIVGRGSKMVDRINSSRSVPVASSMYSEEMSTLPTRRAAKLATPTIKDSRSLPRKSVDLALRHLDVRQNGSSGFRSLVPNMSSSSTSGFYGVVRSVGRVRTGHSASSTASSEHSISIARDLEGSEVGEEVCSELGSRASPRSVSDYREDSVELMQLFRRGIDRLNGAESPLVCQHANTGGASCDLCSIKSRFQSLKASPMSAESLRLSPYSCSSNGALSPSGSHC